MDAAGISAVANLRDVDNKRICNYGNYMARAQNSIGIKLIAIGNSKGIRIPKMLREKYGWGETIVAEETEEGFLLRRDKGRLSWEDTYRAMAAADEDWSDLDATVADGLD